MGRQRTEERKTHKASAYQGAKVKCAPVSFGTPCRDGACQPFFRKLDITLWSSHIKKSLAVNA